MIARHPHAVAASVVALICGGCAAAPSPSPATPAENIARVGETVTLVVDSDGTPPLTFRWERNGQPIPGADGPKLVIENVQLSDAGTYACIVSNSAGAVSEPFQLKVIKP